jgi:hypothetical protein
MQKGSRTIMNARQRRPATASVPRSTPWVSSAGRRERKGAQDAQRSYEQYVALASAEARNGNIVEAENYYQHAEHYYRSMSADR